MYQKILVAIDISPMNQRVFSEGLSVAKANQAQMLLLHVLSTEEETSPLPIPPDITDIYPGLGNELTLEEWRKQWEVFEEKGRKTLDFMAKKAEQAGIKPEYQQISGSPGKTICKMAKDWQADLIVIGRRGRTGIAEIVLGSISNYVLHHAHCSLLIVQH